MRRDGRRRGSLSGVNLALDDAVELTELLQFLSGWLTYDHDRLKALLHRYVGLPDYDLNQLKANLARFAFLLGGDPDGDLFKPQP